MDIQNSKRYIPFDNNTFPVSIALRINISSRHECVCGEIVNKDGSHGYRQKFSPRRTKLNDIIHHALKSANIPRETFKIM